MECGKLTAKLRDAVPVCFIVNGMEVKRLKNIEIPDEIKKLPFTAFKFDVPQNGAITFKIMFEAGVLPEEWPEPRQRKTRGVKPEIQPSEAVLPTTLEIALNHTGERRKELVQAIGNYYGITPVYQNAPTFAYRIGEYEVDKNGTLTGPNDPSLIKWLWDEGFGPQE